MYDEDIMEDYPMDVAATGSRKKFMQEHVSFTVYNEELLKNMKEMAMRSWEARGFTITNEGTSYYQRNDVRNMSWHADARKEVEVG